MPIYVSKGGGGGGADADAIHDNVAGEIAAIAEKTAPVAADLLLGENSAAANAKVRIQIGNLVSGFAEGCYLYMSAAQSIPDTSATALLWDSELYDTDGMHSTASNTDRITCQTAGRYMFLATIYWSGGGAAGLRQTVFTQNGAEGAWCMRMEQFGIANAVTQTIVAFANMSVGDYVGVEVYQTSGAPKDAGAAGPPAYISCFATERIG